MTEREAGSGINTEERRIHGPFLPQLPDASSSEWFAQDGSPRATTFPRVLLRSRDLRRARSPGRGDVRGPDAQRWPGPPSTAHTSFALPRAL